jgi:hypothetical protein
MRREKANKLAKDWANKHCVHPFSEAEYYLGKPTGQNVCTVCGHVVGKKSSINIFKNFFQKEFKIKFRL